MGCKDIDDRGTSLTAMIPPDADRVVCMLSKTFSPKGVGLTGLEPGHLACCEIGCGTHPTVEAASYNHRGCGVVLSLTMGLLTNGTFGRNQPYSLMQAAGMRPLAGL